MKSIIDVYRSYFGDVTFSFLDTPWKTALRLPYAVPARIHVPDPDSFDVGFIQVKTGRIGVISRPTARDIIIDVGQAQEECTLEKHNE